MKIRMRFTDSAVNGVRATRKGKPRTAATRDHAERLRRINEQNAAFWAPKQEEGTPK